MLASEPHALSDAGINAFMWLHLPENAMGRRTQQAHAWVGSGQKAKLAAISDSMPQMCMHEELCASLYSTLTDCTCMNKAAQAQALPEQVELIDGRYGWQTAFSRGNLTISSSVPSN